MQYRYLPPTRRSIWITGAVPAARQQALGLKELDEVTAGIVKDGNGDLSHFSLRSSSTAAPFSRTPGARLNDRQINGAMGAPEGATGPLSSPPLPKA